MEKTAIENMECKTIEMNRSEYVYMDCRHNKMNTEQKLPTTLAEAKEMVAKKQGFKSWADWKEQSKEITGTYNIPAGWHDAAAELAIQGAAREAWDRACEEMISRLSIGMKSDAVASKFIKQFPRPEYETLKR